uniref:Uncharacterized protein n=1 Tax=Rhizophora mucronata TaxID=61149 RepID=A0A2P2JN49_RHIMU
MLLMKIQFQVSSLPHHHLLANKRLCLILLLHLPLHHQHAFLILAALYCVCYHLGLERK